MQMYACKKVEVTHSGITYFNRDLRSKVRIPQVRNDVKFEVGIVFHNSISQEDTFHACGGVSERLFQKYALQSRV